MLKARIEELELQALMETPPVVEWSQVNEMLREYSLACSVTFTESRLDEITDRIMGLISDEYL